MSHHTFYIGDVLECLRRIPDNSVDAIVTDPPYELGFMGKGWDRSGIAYSVSMWQEAMCVLKPGGHLLAFGGTRTYHRMTCAIEDAGFEIRDCIQWIYGSGFPKSLDISKAIDKAAGAEREVIGTRIANDMRGNNYGRAHGKLMTYNDTIPATQLAQQWDGWGTALKPANEPIVLARKPLSEGNVAANVLKWGTGGVNVDGCRIDLDGVPKTAGGCSGKTAILGGGIKGRVPEDNSTGRFPSNVIFDEEAAAVLDQQSGISESTQRFGNRSGKKLGRLGEFVGQQGITMGHSDSGGASRFFYVAKADKAERGAYNNHPTVKPLDLMRYLIKLITPPGGTVLDCFGGSGTTTLAAMSLDMNSIYIDKTPQYAQIALRRCGFDEPKLIDCHTFEVVDMAANAIREVTGR